MQEFDPWAVYYDYIHTGLPGEAAFYVEAAVARSGLCLELGCGTGRIALPTAMSGVSMIGLDISPAMLAVCREKMRMVSPMRGRLVLVEGDMRDFHLGRRFDLITMPYRTFMHCLTREEQLACLRCVGAHLAKGGVFLMNLWAPSSEQLDKFPSVYREDGAELVGAYAIPGDSITLVHYCNQWVDRERFLLHEEHHIGERSSRGRIMHQQELRITRAYIYPEEMRRLVLQAGLKVTAAYGDFDKSPFEQAGGELVLQIAYD